MIYQMTRTAPLYNFDIFLPRFWNMYVLHLKVFHSFAVIEAFFSRTLHHHASDGTGYDKAAAFFTPTNTVEAVGFSAHFDTTRNARNWIVEIDERGFLYLA